MSNELLLQETMTDRPPQSAASAPAESLPAGCDPGASRQPGVAQGRIVIVSGPSGVGKSSLLGSVFARLPRLVDSVSATTRAPRPGEQDGVDYYFLTPEEFARRRERGEFLECFEVFGQGVWYGTLECEVAPSLLAGKWVLLEIDVQGAQRVREAYPDALTIFIRPSSWEELERRLRSRGTESDAAIQRRLDAARRELAQAQWYQHQIINDDLDRAVDELCDLLTRYGV